METTEQQNPFNNPEERKIREQIKNVHRKQIAREETDYYTVQTFKKNVENYINNGSNN